MTSDQTDLLSDILQTLRVRGGLYFSDEMGAATGDGDTGAAQAAAHWALDVPPSPQRVKLHVVTRGGCLVQLGEGPHERRVVLGSGELAVVPHGRAHRILSDGRHASTRLVCGEFHQMEGLQHPLLDTLPPIIHVAPQRIRDSGGERDSGEDWLGACLRFIEAEASASRPGFGAMVDRLTELLFIQALRHLAEREDGDDSFLAGLGDAALARALGAIHRQPARAWSVGELAAVALLSRTAFANRFQRRLGMPPMQYLTRWRMILASRLLGDRSLAIAEIAERCGYLSEAAFSRVFKRHSGLGPGRFRRDLAG